MKLYYSPLACSMATVIALSERGLAAELVAVDHKTRLAPDGTEVHPLGLVPVLHTDDGLVLTENAAILQYVGEGSPFVPADSWSRSLLQQWLSFIGTELHKGVFIPLLDKKAPEGAKSYALANAAPRLALLERHLTGREHLLESYSVADMYLVTVLNWTQATSLRLATYPALAAYFARIVARPKVAEILSREMVAYLAEAAA